MGAAGGRRGGAGGGCGRAEVRMAARVWGQSGYGVELAHMTLLVRLDETTIADVGFGEGFREPLRLVEASGRISAGETWHG